MKNGLPYMLIFVSIVFSCAKPDVSKRSVEIIESDDKQESIFKDLVGIVDNSIQEEALNDSLAFLILPVQASCPSCRKKTIDSLLSHRLNLRKHHYIVISANGGVKTISAYFKRQNADIPTIENKLFIDSINRASRLNLCKDRPTIYYSYNRKAYKKVAAVPVTVRDDLREFFSGFRN